jgi:hypothetical protein
LRARLTVVLALSVVGGVLPAYAELDASDYAVGATPSPDERERLQRAIAAEREAEAAREEARQAAEGEARQRTAAAEARRPPEERLLEARCTKCHTLEQVSAARHTPIGWWFTVLRMRWWNGAAMTGEEAELLVAHLAQSQPARGGARLVEYALAALGVSVVPGSILLYRRRRHTGVDRSVSLMAGGVLGATLLLWPPHVAVADTAAAPQTTVEPPSGESRPQLQPAPVKEGAPDAPRADAPSERRSPAPNEKPSEPPSMGLCSGQ